MISIGMFSIYLVRLFAASAGYHGALLSAEPPTEQISPPRPPAGAVPVPFSVAGGSLHVPVDLCKLTAMSTTGGVYTVESMAATLEDDTEGNHDRPYTYANLVQVEEWSKGAPKTVTVRMAGGPLKDPKYMRTSPVSLAVGDTFGYVFSYPANNKGFAGIDELWIFRSHDGGGYSNGQIFGEVDWTPSIVAFWFKANFAAKSLGLGAKDSCPLQVYPKGAKEG